jgi:flagellar motility protein MotE (MotC chaperone)
MKQKIASSLTLLAMTVRNTCGSLRAKRSNLNALVSHRELLKPGLQICNQQPHVINFYNIIKTITAEPFIAREKSLMNYLKIFIIITFLMFSVSAAAEFYKYVDEEGNVRFTDDINQVPVAQRAKIRSYIESVSDPPPEQEATQENQADQAAADQQTNFPDLSDDEPESLADAKNQIEKLKSEIDQEYEALLKEKEQLAKEKKQAKTREQIIEYNKKIEHMNKRVEAYEENGKAYKAQVDAYNVRITNQNSRDQTQ